MNQRPTRTIPAAHASAPTPQASAHGANGTVPPGPGPGPQMIGNPELMDSFRGWLVALGAGLSTGMAFGTIYTFGAFIESMADEFGTGQGTASIMLGIATFLFFGTGIVSGPLLHHLGPRPLMAAGGLLFFCGLAGTSAVSELWQGYLIYGIGCGFGSGLFVSPVFATATAWFMKRRAIALGVVATGPGLGTMVMVPLAEWLIAELNWRIAYRYLAIAAMVTFVICFLMLRRPPVTMNFDPRPHVRRVSRTKAFWQMAAGASLFSIPLIGSLAAVIPFARSVDISSAAAARLIALIGASSIVGRILLTSFARQIGSVRLFKICYGTMPVAYAIWLLAGDSYGLMVLFALVLGVSYGGYVALMGDVTPHLFGVAGIGSVMGRLFFFFGVGSLIGPPAMLFLQEASGGTVLPIALVTGVSAVGALVIRPMTREPVPLPSPADPSPPARTRTHAATAPSQPTPDSTPAPAPQQRPLLPAVPDEATPVPAPLPRPLVPAAATVGESTPRRPAHLAPPSVWIAVPADAGASR